MILGQPLSLSEEHRYALDSMEHSRENLFITGRAGTGKSTLLQLFKKTTKKRTVVLAPTGIAALNVQGQTIHSFFGFPPKMLTKADIGRRKNYRMYLNVETIVIDEISMVRVDMLDNIDWFLRVNRGRNIPFGGVQMIFFGDLFQLPPVIATPLEREYLVEHYESPYFFSAEVFRKESDFRMIELSVVYRQDERQFISLLDNIRMNDVDEYDLMDLNERFIEELDEEEFVITLSSRNALVNEINRKRLNEIEGEEFSFLAQVAGNFSPSSFPAELVLKLKLGAQVMFVKNDPEKRFVNGTLGIVSSINHDVIVVNIKNRNDEISRIEVPRLLWEIQKYIIKDNNIQTEVVGTFDQFPIKLAWAITIHKSQGKTFDKVIIDIGQSAFEFGQTYVALSRCRTLDGIFLKRKMTSRDIFVDEKVVDFYTNKKRYS